MWGKKSHLKSTNNGPTHTITPQWFALSPVIMPTPCVAPRSGLLWMMDALTCPSSECGGLLRGHKHMISANVQIFWSPPLHFQATSLTKLPYCICFWGAPPPSLCRYHMYRDRLKSMQILLSRTQAGPGRTVKQEQEEISPNYVQRINLISVHMISAQGGGGHPKSRCSKEA